ncbi:MAG: phosphoribosylanthranilate isomerase [Endozoicomonadaceae bacterium]|nr:phosphoribosylanthranilate isomerase [Endozoicomonadaceae bacterium]MBE8233066.1 phosphoribosylanthranilate isomerase [Endozoicomonadaceae bacterium]
MLFKDKKLNCFSSSPKVKLCGFTTPAPVLCALDCGVDAIGLIFYEKSPRFVSIEQATVIADIVKNRADLVGVFVNASEKMIQAVLSEIPLSVLQFHGHETLDFCKKWVNIPWIKVISVHPDACLTKPLDLWSPHASVCLLDTHSVAYGGSGVSFNWSLIPSQYRKKIILSGGLNINTVQKAIKIVQPFAVDASSAIETSLGIKSCPLIKVFLREIHEIS